MMNTYKWLCYIGVCLLLALSLSADARMSVVTVGSGGGAAAATNFCNDANAVGCWYMNGAYGGDGSEAETDRTSAGNNVTVSASDTIPDADDRPSGYSGRSRDFEKTDSDYLTIADGTELDINGADAKISIVAWIKMEAPITNTTEYGIVSKYATAGNQRQYLLETSGVGSTFKVCFAVSADGTNISVVCSATTTYATGTWYHVAAVANDIDLRIYVNGVLGCEPAAHTTGIYNGSDPFFIGSLVISLPFDGLIDEVAVFSRDLSATEVAAIYNNGITGNKGGSD